MKIGFPVWKRGVFLTSCLVAAALPFIGPRLPVDSLVTDLKVGVYLGELFVSDIDFDLNKGEYLVVLLDDDCSHCDEIVEKLNQLAVNDHGPKVLGILVGDRDMLVEFWWKYGATFHLGHVPRGEVVNLYRTLPRMFLLKDGVVQRIWNDRLTMMEEFHKFEISSNMSKLSETH